MRSVIMCVDDDNYVLRTLSEQLGEWFGRDYIIAKASSGEEGLEVLDKFLADKVNVSVCISDYVMPGMSGDAFLKMVHEREPAIKTIMLTGHSAIDGVVFAINNAGLYRFISKPWDPKDLRLTIAEAAKSYEQAQVMRRLYEDSKNIYAQYSDQARSLKAHFDAALTCVIGATENIIDKSAREGASTHCLAVKHYALQLAKIQGLSDYARFETGFLGLLHEIGKYGFCDSELRELELARRRLDYSHPAVLKMHEKTCVLSSGFGIDCVKIMRDIYKPYGEDVPIAARIISCANTFDNLNTTLSGQGEARKALFKQAQDGFLDADLVKALLNDVKPYEGD